MLTGKLRKNFFYLVAISIIILAGSCTSSPEGSKTDVSEAYTEKQENEAGYDPVSEDPGDQTDVFGSSQPDIPAEKFIPSREIPVYQLLDMVGDEIPGDLYYVSDDSFNPVTVFHDLDGNGIEDILMLLLKYDESAEDIPEDSVRNRCISSSGISDMARLFSEKSKPHPYYLLVFQRTPAEISRMYMIPLGSWYVYDRMYGFILDKKDALPYCLNVDFQTHEGQESQWIIFPDPGRYTTFSLKNSISVNSEIRDMDKDGVIDVLEWRRVFEEGTGYETFLTWYKWNGKDYEQKGTTNVVRNLNRFLQKAGYLLSSGKWDQALQQVLSPEQFRRMNDSAAALEEIFLVLFPPRTIGSSSSREQLLKENITDDELRTLLTSDERVFNMVVFPQVLENPFAAGNGNCCEGYSTRFSVRFVFRNGRSIVRECTVRMNENPFASRQFYLEPMPEEQ